VVAQVFASRYKNVKAGFDGWVYPEHMPLGGTETSLGWLRDWGYWANT
jgi:hydroxypyruvate isomerase